MDTTSGGRQILVHGIALVLTGLVFGLAIPHTPYPRLALGAHTQFATNGMLLILIALALLTVQNRVGRRSMAVLVIAAWLIWPMALSEAANAWWGTTQMLPISAAQAGATGGTPWQEAVVKLTHIIAGLGLIVACTLLLVGFLRRPRAAAE